MAAMRGGSSRSNGTTILTTSFSRQFPCRSKALWPRLRNAPEAQAWLLFLSCFFSGLSAVENGLPGGSLGSRTGRGAQTSTTALANGLAHPKGSGKGMVGGQVDRRICRARLPNSFAFADMLCMCTWIRARLSSSAANCARNRSSVNSCSGQLSFLSSRASNVPFMTSSLPPKKSQRSR